ncbi:MAG TPA: metal-dependent transcriptional regulator [Solirubrobacterales bacterium]|jgi:DtxR family Mn-dependent transcriptional regulator|nr:metal-dependent transcriptional regulator [Solirubrobacterales bacterium]
MSHTRTSSKADPSERTSAPATEAVEDYVKAIYALQRQEGGPVSTSALAERLDVAPPSVTAMVKRLDELHLVRYEPYHGVTLTGAGERLALEVIRHHRLIEAFLADALEMPWDRVHDEAEVLEHYISEDLERRIAEKLGNPSLDPHGDPIPTPELALAADRTTALDRLAAGDVAIFSRVSDSDPAMLRYLAERGIRPGARLRVTEVQPFGGPVVVDVDGHEHALGGNLAQRLRVERAESSP